VTAVTGRLHWPISMRDAIRFELTDKLPLDVEALVAQVRADAYAAGRLETLRQIARDIGELDILGEGWRERAVAEVRKQERQRRAVHEERAAARGRERNIAAGRHPDWQYRGRSGGGSGAVCWETGYPVETVNAWLRRPRWMPLPTTRAVWIPVPGLPPEPSNVTPLRERQESKARQSSQEAA
jgi:hypothetical protein